MDNKDLYIRSIAESLKKIAEGESTHSDLGAISAKLDDIATKLDAIDGHLNPLYNADYTVPDDGE